MSVTLSVVAIAGAKLMAMLALFPSQSGGSIAATDAADLAKRGEALLIDIRRPDEWRASGRPQGALGITLEDPLFIDKIRAAAGEDKNKPLILICRSGRRTLAGMSLLAQAGFTHLAHIGEGMVGSEHGAGWLNHDLPLEMISD